MSALSKFSGEAVSLGNRLQQYTHFVRNLFIAPHAGAVKGEWDSWQLDPICRGGIPRLIIRKQEYGRVLLPEKQIATERIEASS